MRSRWLACGLLLTVVAAAWGGWSWVQLRADRQELEQSRRDVAEGQHPRARRRLIELARRRPGWDEVHYQLGLCDEARGRADAALAEWSRVATGSSFAGKTSVARARVLTNIGRFAEAEDVLLAIPRGRDAESTLVRQALELLYRVEGRNREVRELILESWADDPDRGHVLRRLYLLDDSAFPVEYVKQALQGGDAKDDRVWLGRANLAIWMGQLEEAGRWLDTCFTKRPEDPAVLSARLDLALALEDPGAVRRALDRLPVRLFLPVEIARLRCWLAERLGDEQVERRELNALTAEEPGESRAWDRLAELAQRAGRSDQVEAFRKKKAEMSELRERYAAMTRRDDRDAHAEELGRLAETLGRRIEAHGWSLIHRGLAGREALIPSTETASPGREESRPEYAASRMDDLLRKLPADAGRRHAGRTDDRGPAPAVFADVAESAGLRFFHDNGHTRKNPPPTEAMCGGVGLIDYDGDGWLDVYVVQGGEFPPRGTAFQAVNQAPEQGDSVAHGTASRGTAFQAVNQDHGLDVRATQDHGQDARATQDHGQDAHATQDHGQDARATNGDRLFHNLGNGRFEDVSERCGIAGFTGGYGHGVAVGDYDNDGRPDLFVTRWRSYALYRNRGDGTFEDATAAAGLGGNRDWPTSSAFADLDNDGDLDLYVCHYLRYDPANPKRCEHPGSPSLHECNPLDFPSLPDHVFRNDGGRFVDVTGPASIIDPNGRGLGVVAVDLDGDDRVDLCVANDMTANYLFRNLGGFRFEETGTVAGVACAADGNFRAGMGIACGDLDGDGRPDLAVTNYFGESTTFYHNLGGGLFIDRTAEIGLTAPSRPLLGFGAAFFDANNDGWLDLITANGHVLDARPRFPWTMPLQLLLGSPGGRLTDASKRAGPPFQAMHLGRGLAVGDLDHDGRPDVLVVAQNEPLIALHNESGRTGHFIVFQLEGTRSNRDAVGAKVAVTCGGRVRVAHRFGGGSYQSASDPRLHFGLGEVRRVDGVEVRWPSGRVDRFGPLEADSAYRLVEGAKEARPLAGWPGRPR